ncbi:uncharacterized protein LOC111640320 [Centruroides sculpturatus]|nr:uncharacterized protein LOC111640320 [Centruroides sculpturatus]
MRRNVVRGCPQGSVCGPILWNTVFDNFLRQSFGHVTIAYADDAIVLLGGNSRAALEIFGNDTLCKISKWGKEYKLTFNINKTMGIVFNKPGKPNLYRRTPVIKMDGQSVKIVKSIKYLGIILDHRLLWNTHIAYITDRTGSIFNILTGFAKRRWGLTTDALNIIYKQIFVPIITYACGSWSQDIYKIHINRKLISAQRKALIQLTRAYCTTPNVSIQVLARCPPIDKIIDYTAKIWHIKWGQNIQTDDYIIRAEDVERPVAFNQSRHPATTNNFAINTYDNADFHLFTDGSKTGNRVGCSFIAYCREEILTMEQYRLGENCSNFQAELFAIQMAVAWCKHNYTNKRISVNTDCSSAIALLKTRNYHPIANRIQDIINTSTCHFAINWIRGHQGHYGNELADELAKEASYKEDLPVSYKRISIQTIKTILWKEVIHAWQLQWNNINNKTHEYITDITNFLSNKWYKPTHQLTQILTNHGRFYSYLSRFKGTSNSRCLICDCNDSSDHYIYTCPMLENERLILKLLLESHDLHWPPPTLERLFDHKDTFDAFVQLVNMYFVRTSVPAYSGH